MKINLINSEVFGDGDGRAINRHSVREYEVEGLEGVSFLLDKNLSGSPAFYDLCIVDPYHYFGRSVPNLLSDGMSWAAAKREAFQSIKNYINDNYDQEKFK